MQAVAAELRQAQRMEAVGRFSGGISHDFNNLLTAMLGFTELLQQDHSLSAAARRDVEEVHRSASSAMSLTRQLLAFSRKQLVNPTTLDLNCVVTEVLMNLAVNARDAMGGGGRLDLAIRQDAAAVTLEVPAGRSRC